MTRKTDEEIKTRIMKEELTNVADPRELRYITELIRRVRINLLVWVLGEED